MLLYLVELKSSDVTECNVENIVLLFLMRSFTALFPGNEVFNFFFVITRYVYFSPLLGNIKQLVFAH